MTKKGLAQFYVPFKNSSNVTISKISKLTKKMKIIVQNTYIVEYQYKLTSNEKKKMKNNCILSM